ncbi:MAG: acetylglutamate kinase, partial [Thermoguttaceae bacterium]|nr:acetylglutamate kinase [Thermoguttaceae bacterium]
MVNRAIEKADILIEAMKWIREHRGKVTVIKLGGSLLDDEASVEHLLLDTVFMETVGMRPVIVHGGGNAISRAMKEEGIEPRFVQGRRYTDDVSLSIVRRVLAGDISRALADRISAYSGCAEPLSDVFGTNVLFGKKMALSGPDGEQIDLV